MARPKKQIEISLEAWAAWKATSLREGKSIVKLMDEFIFGPRNPPRKP